jgi:flagellar biosynthesis/type III secretory pathway protein FliH
MGAGPAPTAARVVAGDLDAFVERLRRAAYEEGEAAGRRAEREGAARRLDEAAERADAAGGEAAADLAHTAVQLALEIARQLVRREVDAGRHDLERIVRDTLAAAGAGRGACVVHLHPSDVEALRGARFRSGTRLQADVGVARGDVHVETSLGLMVREIDDALAAIGARLAEELS